MPLHFDSVEVIELPFVAGPNHPSQRFCAKELEDRSDVNSVDSRILNDGDALDSASVTLGWKPSSRSRISFEDYEEERQNKKKRKGKRGKLRKLTRAVKKRILRQNGVETSDIESEDERSSGRKKKKKKKKSMMRIPGKKAVMSRFRSNDFRFSAEAPSTDTTPAGPSRPGVARQDSMPQMPSRFPISPVAVSVDEGPELDGHLASPHGDDEAVPKMPDRVMSPPLEIACSPDQGPRTNRIGSMQQMKDAVVYVAKKPVKYAKKPVKLAKKQIKKVLNSNSGGLSKAKNQEDGSDHPSHPPMLANRLSFDQEEARAKLPCLPPVYVPGEASDDDKEEIGLLDIGDKNPVNEIVFVPDLKVALRARDEDNEDDPAKDEFDEEDIDENYTTWPERSSQGKSSRGILVRSKSAIMDENARKMDRWSSMNFPRPPSTRYLPTMSDIFDLENESGTASPSEDEADGFIDPYPRIENENHSHLENIGHMANAIGSLAYQPVRLPVKLAKSTHKRLKKNRRKTSSVRKLSHEAVQKDGKEPDSLPHSPAGNLKDRYQSTKTMETHFDFWSSDEDEMDLKTGSSVDRSYDSDTELEDDPIRELRERRASQRSRRSFVAQKLDETMFIVDDSPLRTRRNSQGGSINSRSSMYSRGSAGSRHSQGSSRHCKQNLRPCRVSMTGDVEEFAGDGMEFMTQDLHVQTE